MNALAVLRRPRRAMALALIGLATLAVTGCGGGGDFPVDAYSAPGASPPIGVAAEPPTPRAAAPVEAGRVAPAAASASGAATTAAARGELTIVTPPREVRTPLGSVALFSVQVDGPPGIRYQWLRDDEPIVGATGSVLQLPVVADDDLVKISVVVSTDRIRLQSKAALLRVTGA